MKIKKIIFWQPCISPHTRYLIGAIAELMSDVEIISIAEVDALDQRTQLGWTTNGKLNFSEYSNLSACEIRKNFLNKQHDTLHVVSGMSLSGFSGEIYRLIFETGANFFVLSEPRADEGILGFVRLMHSLVVERKIRKNVDAVLAIGVNGSKWFKKANYRDAIIFDFAYFIPRPKLNDSKSYRSNNKINIAYVGRIIKEKGVLSIVPGIKNLREQVVINFVGKGDCEDLIAKQASEYNLDCKFHGVVNNENIGNFIGDMDILVLLSETSDDGWGVVVSESLLIGTPVVVRNKVGSSLVVGLNENFGLVIYDNKPKSIEDAVICLINKNAFSSENRIKRIDEAKKLLTNEVGAFLFKNITESVYLNKEKSKWPRIL